MKRWLILVMLLGSTFSFANTLNIGVLRDNPPFCMQTSTTEYNGFDINLILEICRRIHANCQFAPMSFDKLFTSIDTNSIDLAIATITISPDRQKHYLFSLPYFPSDAELLTIQSSGIKSVEDINHKRIGVHQGNLRSPLLKKVFPQDFTIIQYPSTGDLLMALNNKSIDAVLLELGSAQYWFSNNFNLYKLIPPPVTVGNGYGIMAKKGQETLIADINKAMLSIESDGTYIKLYNEYFMP